MGSPTNEQDRFDEGPQTEVTISRGFWMGKYEVTQGEYTTLMSNNPSFFNGVRSYQGTNVDFGTDLSRPVESVSRENATNYCHVLTELDRTAGRIPSNCTYRLPTEAEWEYSCRALTSTRFSYGDDPAYTNLTHYAWYAQNSDHRTHAVGQKLPNPWGLFDMHGNVWEFCLDRYFYPGGSALNPQGAIAGAERIVRGGGTESAPRWCRSAVRGIASVIDVANGLRVVLVPGSQ
jgi:formylglycine-generating enzyme required for sulfatase activity